MPRLLNPFSPTAETEDDLLPDRAGIRARARYDRDAAYALSVLPRLSNIEDEALANARRNASPSGEGLADGFRTFLRGAFSRLAKDAPSPEAGALTGELLAPPHERLAGLGEAHERAARDGHLAAMLDGAVAATRARIVADPAGAEDSFADLLGGLTLAADGWLGRDRGEVIARDLEAELFPAAARRLVERDPAGAADRLEEGLFGERLGEDMRGALLAEARERAAARQEDEKSRAVGETRQAEAEGFARRQRESVQLIVAAEGGTATREQIAAAASEGRLDRTSRAEALAALARAEDEAVARHAAVARVEDYLGSGIVEGDRPDAGGKGFQ